MRRTQSNKKGFKRTNYLNKLGRTAVQYVDIFNFSIDLPFKACSRNSKVEEIGEHIMTLRTPLSFFWDNMFSLIINYLKMKFSTGNKVSYLYHMNMVSTSSLF